MDTSVGSLLALTAAMALGLQSYLPWYSAVIVVLLVGVFIGFINGVLTAKVRIVAIIVTLGMMTIS